MRGCAAPHERQKILHGERKRPGIIRAWKAGGSLSADALGGRALRDDALGVVRKLFRLWHKIERLKDFGITFRAYLEAFVLSESVDEHFTLEVRSDSVIILNKISLGIGDLLLIQELAELLQYVVIHIEVLADLVGYSVVLREVEEGIVLK